MTEMTNMTNITEMSEDSGAGLLSLNLVLVVALLLVAASTVIKLTVTTGFYDS